MGFERIVRCDQCGATEPARVISVVTVFSDQEIVGIPKHWPQLAMGDLPPTCFCSWECITNFCAARAAKSRRRHRAAVPDIFRDP